MDDGDVQPAHIVRDEIDHLTDGGVAQCRSTQTQGLSIYHTCRAISLLKCHRGSFGLLTCHGYSGLHAEVEHAQHVGMHEEHIEGATQDHAQGVQIGLCLVIFGVIVLRIESDQTAQAQWLGDSKRVGGWRSYKLNGHKSPRYLGSGRSQDEPTYRKPISKMKSTRPKPAKRHPKTLIEAFSRLGVFFFLLFFSTSLSQASLSWAPRVSESTQIVQIEISTNCAHCMSE